jgi:hypothetical protein
MEEQQSISEIGFIRSSFFTQLRKTCQGYSPPQKIKAERVAGGPSHLAEPWFHE